jgi:F0F1-type ATP synthase membrane subunit c/vacuolar-type H+-ATPase subunit K
VEEGRLSPESKETRGNSQPGRLVGIGIAIGAGAGSGVGIAPSSAFDNPGVGLAVGIGAGAAIGAAIGAAMEQRQARSEEE